jgi:sugar-specific transcriptional regulator TrmB
MIDLEFDDASEAQAYLAALQCAVYSSREASQTSGNPQTRIVEVVEAKEY